MDWTQTLTGLLPLVVITAALLGLPISLLLLRLYRRSVVKAMSTQATDSGGAAPIVKQPGLEPAGSPQRPPVRVRAATVTATSTPPSRAAPREPWRAAVVYGGAAVAYASVMTAGWLVATRDPAISWIKVLTIFWTYLWPLTLTVVLVAVADGRTALKVCVAYFLGWSVLAVIAVARSPSLGAAQLPLYWALEVGPPSLLVLAFLARPVRAVGPMVLAFLVVAVTGSQILLSLAQANPALLQAIARVGFALGLRATGVFLGMVVTGLVLFAASGWILLRWLGRRYEEKKLSDESLTVDSIWLLFGVVQSIGLAFEGPPWILTGVVAFAAYKLIAMAGFRLLAAASSGRSQRMLLLLRVFALGKRSEQLFRALRKLWLRGGSIALIAGPDLATTTVEPHEFLAFVGGGLRRQFVGGAADLDRRLAELDLQPNPDGAYRVNEFFCHADTWQMTMRRLASRSDAVLMDLRSFSRSNHGCLYELEQLLEAVDIDKVVFLIDGTTDEALLQELLQRLSANITPQSPNWRTVPPVARLFPIRTRSRSELAALLGLLASGRIPEVAH